MCGGEGERHISSWVGGGKAYMKLKRYERGFFDSFSKRGSALYEADMRGGQQYSDILLRSLYGQSEKTGYKGSEDKMRSHLNVMTTHINRNSQQGQYLSMSRSTKNSLLYSTSMELFCQQCNAI